MATCEPAVVGYTPTLGNPDPLTWRNRGGGGANFHKGGGHTLPEGGGGNFSQRGHTLLEEFS